MEVQSCLFMKSIIKRKKEGPELYRKACVFWKLTENDENQELITETQYSITVFWSSFFPPSCLLLYEVLKKLAKNWQRRNFWPVVMGDVEGSVHPRWWSGVYRQRFDSGALPWLFAAPHHSDSQGTRWWGSLMPVKKVECETLYLNTWKCFLFFMKNPQLSSTAVKSRYCKSIVLIFSETQTQLFLHHVFWK